MARNGAIPARTKQKIKDFENAREELIDLVGDNPEVFEAFFTLSDKYNTAHGEAKDAMKNLRTDERVAVGPFMRKARSVSTGYDPTKLAPGILTSPGVIKSLDSKKIDDLVLNGVISQADVAGARVVRAGSAAVVGPKLVTVEL